MNTETFLIIIGGLIFIEGIIIPVYKKHKDRNTAIKILGTVSRCVDNNHSGTKEEISKIIKMLE